MWAVRSVNNYAVSRYTTAITSMICTMTARPEALANQRVSWSVMLKERSLHSSACLSGASVNKLMKKMVKNKKKQWYETPFRKTELNQSGFLKPPKRNQEDSVRLRTLNNIIYKTVTDLLSSYELNSEISAYNVEISKVSLTRDFSACRIYWKSSLSAEQDRQTQQALDKCAPHIRHILISHQIIGNVPPVVFVRDKQYAAVTEIENLLKQADFGPVEDSINYSTTSDDGTKLQPVDFEDKKRLVLFGVDHEALHKQIEAYKREKGAKDSCTLLSPATEGLTQEQLDTLAEIRKQKLIEKKKKKSKRIKDDDITLKDFLLSRSFEKEEQDSDEDRLEENQISELIEEDDRRR